MSYQQYRPQSFKVLPMVVKNLLIINGLLWLATFVMQNQGVDLSHYLGLHYFGSTNFKPYQIVTYMFMHGGLEHVFFNMFALWMFGNVLENYWGSKRFLIFYMATGIGAALFQMAIAYFQLQSLYPLADPTGLNEVFLNGAEIMANNQAFIDPTLHQINSIINTPMVGASGAVFGVLLAFGMLFPNTLLYVYFLIPIKAKYFVILYGALELYLGISNNAGDNVAHFAHLGGMLFGFILIKYWQKKRGNFY